MSLVSLPAELLQHICRYVREVDHLVAGVKIPGGKLFGVTEYRSLALSCRQLYKIALPHLYQYIYLGPCSTNLLVRSIVENPQLAFAIQEMTLGGRLETGNVKPDLGEAYTLLQKPDLLPQACTRNLLPTDADAIFVLLVEVLLLHLPNVEKLSINIDHFPQNNVLFNRRRWKPTDEAYLSRLLPAMEDLTVYAQPGRRNLRADEEQASQQGEQETRQNEQEPQQGEERLESHLESGSVSGPDSEPDPGPGPELDSDDSDSEWESDEDELETDESRDIIAEAQYLIALSKPKHLVIETDHPLEHAGFGLTMPSIEELEICCQGMDQEDFHILLNSFPNIRLFKYYGGSGPPDTHDMAAAEIKLREIVTILRDHEQGFKHKLESLEVGFHNEDEGDIMAYDTIPDLRPFSRLTNLKLDWNSLFSLPQNAIYLPIEVARVKFIDKLPRTLEQLRIFQPDQQHLEELKSLASRKAEDLPNFKSLTLEWWSGEDTKPLDDLDVELSKAGIVLVLQ